LNPLIKHLADVINDLALKEQAWNSYKILKNNNVKKSINERAGREDFRQLDLWLKDVFGAGLMGTDTYSKIVSQS
jgi:hypothetical protein